MKLLLPGIASLSLVSAIPAVAAEQALGRGDVAPIVEKLWAEHVETVRVERADEVIAGEVRVEGTAMRYLARVFGERPKEGRSLFISMHGGGGTTASANDQQWANQIRLYQPAEGIYIAPRAPGNSWNLWHTAKIDPLFGRLIETMVVIGGVNPDKVYLIGYSAGGDGVYQLAPRMSDRFAAAAMMAGHPNETSPLGLRNIPFALQVGALDAAYDRNKIAGQWGEKLAALREEDPGGYENFVRVREGKPHWMDLEDKEAVPWMAKFERRRFPDRVVWKQDDVTHSQFYWLALPDGQVKARQLIVAKRDGQTVTIEKAEDVGKVTVLLNDEMVDLDQRVKVVGPEGDVLFEGLLDRSRTVIERTLKQRGDRRMVFSAEVTVEVGASKAQLE